MRVKTLDKNMFQSECLRLAHNVLDSGFMPEMIIGIRTGGEYVARAMAPMFPDTYLSFVELQRPSTSGKKGIRNILPLLPTPLLNFLRIFEARLLSLRKPENMNLPPLEIPDDIISYLPSRILIADDAVDSGRTLLTVKKTLSETDRNIDIRTVSITVTTKSPLILPDYYLYHDETLIRFPWSFDNKKK